MGKKTVLKNGVAIALASLTVVFPGAAICCLVSGVYITDIFRIRAALYTYGDNSN